MSRDHNSEPESDAGEHPDDALIICDFKCSIEDCSRKFTAAASFPKADGFISRPILLPESTGISGYRHVIPFEPNGRRNMSGDRSSSVILPSHPYEPVFQVQIEIMENRGKVFRVMDYLERRGYSPAAFSDKFRKAAGITLKSFANKIRLCHALWDLLFNQKAIKSIALDFGYDPISFSLKFFKTFNAWPSQVRKTAGSPSDVLESHFMSLRERERESMHAQKYYYLFENNIMRFLLTEPGTRFYIVS